MGLYSDHKLEIQTRNSENGKGTITTMADNRCNCRLTRQPGSYGSQRVCKIQQRHLTKGWKAGLWTLFLPPTGSLCDQDKDHSLSQNGKWMEQEREKRNEVVPRKCRGLEEAGAGDIGTCG